MLFNTIISFLACVASVGVAVCVFLRWGQSFVSFTLIAGILLTALEAGFSGVAGLSNSTDELLRWQRMAVFATALQPGVWILFALSFVRARYDQTLARRKWIIVGVFIFPMALTLLFGGFLFRDAFVGETGWIVPLGWTGQIFHLFLLVSAVVILMNLERTFRASAGEVRWKIKFLILGVGSLWAVRIYTSSQTLLFSSVSSELQNVSFTFLLPTCVLILLSLWRTRVVAPNLYVSESLIYNSLIALLVGLYLIIVGILAKVMSHLGETTSIHLDSFILFLALIALSVVLLSDAVRQRTKQWLSRHLNRPQFDYRQVWRDFTQQTSALLDETELAASVTRLLARTFGVSSAGIWLWNETTHTLGLTHGTFSPEYSACCIAADADMQQLVRASPMPCDLKRVRDGWPRVLRDSCPKDLFPAHVTQVTPLLVNEAFLGFVTLNDKLTGEPFSPEELELFRTLSEQTAASLLNQKMSRDLTTAREAEAFQRMSAFFVHDLKNLAASLSLTVNNLPRHFDNREFRADALKSITRGVEKMNNLCGLLSSLKEAPSLVREDHDLNGLVESTLADLNGIRTQISTGLQETGRVYVDAEEVKKVVHNLILNSREASGEQGRINVRTEARDRMTVLSVSDNGCGMSREFIDNKLFRPFTSTKEKGLGIGLFQCKQIVEAHNGRIEVESEEGKGTTFRVYLPGKRASQA